LTVHTVVRQQYIVDNVTNLLQCQRSACPLGDMGIS
jgi:hypothetical protein